VTASRDPAAGQAVLELVAVMDRLRRECPWDQEQTHASLTPHLLEEAHEVLEALEAGDRPALREELGDLLLQVMFHARIAQEDPDDPWGLDEVADGARRKMVHRHPHVFAELSVSGVDEVAANWEQLKATEKSRASVLDGVPPSLPALARADKVLGRLERAGYEPSEPASSVDRSAADRTLGAALLALVREARTAGVDAEGALRRTLRDLEAAVRARE
jgi:XTP/dITP diphosphohydrolase